MKITRSITLKAARVNAGYTQAQVEKELGFSRSTLTRWESGKHVPSAIKLKQLCRLYGVLESDISIKQRK